MSEGIDNVDKSAPVRSRSARRSTVALGALKVNVLPRICVAGALVCAAWLARPSDLALGHISEESGFIDIDLPITDIVQEPGVIRIIGQGKLDGSVVGFEVDFPSKSGKPSDITHPLQVGTARFRTLGADSDRFVALLAKRYGLPGLASKMLRSVNASAVGLGEDPARALAGKKDMKFFFYDSGTEDRYAEVFINVNFEDRILQFQEKAEDYRKPLILALAKGP